MKFIKKFYEQDQNLNDFGIKELRYGLTFEKIKTRFPWILDADIRNAVLGIYEKFIVFYSGSWHDGVWKGGTWEGGTWEDGTWEGGTWESGVWKDGIWKNGVWQDGQWQDGYWGSGIWKGGTWRGGFIKDILSKEPPN